MKKLFESSFCEDGNSFLLMVFGSEIFMMISNHFFIGYFNGFDKLTELFDIDIFICIEAFVCIEIAFEIADIHHRVTLF